MKQWLKVALIVVLSFAVFFEFAQANPFRQSKSKKFIRVAVLRDVPSFNLEIRGAYKVYDIESRSIILENSRLKPTKLELKKDVIQFGEKSLLKKSILIDPRHDSTVVVNKRRFRGSVKIYPKEKGFTVVNIIELEKYVRGVLYHEISDRWPLAAIKAQAIATRTYALYSASNRKAYEYDVTNDIYSQVYGGRESEKYRTNLGVKRTKGLVLEYDKKILPAFFHANSGGHTEDASQLWKVDIPPLKGVHSPFSVDMKHYRWKKNVRLKDIQDKLNAKGYKLGLIKDISVLKRNKSGRIKNLLISTRDGGEYKITGKNFRLLVGPNLIRSNNYVIQMKGYYADFIGKGWGHGVGMCQWGAYNMAKNRYGYDKILNHYYPQAKIVHWKSLGK